MGIYIKGMKMPSCCGKCPFMYRGFYKGESYPCVCYAKAQPMLIKPSETDMRDGLCPLVEVCVPHGRLVDADKMCADLATVDPQYETMIEWCIQVTNAQPTVIEAEKEGE